MNSMVDFNLEQDHIITPNQCPSDNTDGPMPLYRKEKTSSQFPIDALGPILGELAVFINNTVQASQAICAQSLLAAASLTTQSHKNIEIDGRVYPLSLYFMTVADSGERKSAVDKIALRPIRNYEKQLNDKYQPLFQQFAKEKEAYDACKKKIMAAKGKTIQQRVDMVDELGPEPTAPLQPIILIEDPTIEGLVKLLSYGQPSVGLFSDEGGRMFGGHGMSQESQLRTITGLSNLWDGSAISRVRSGDGATKIYGKRLSTHLMIQPPIADQIFSNSMFIQQGFLPRYLVAWPTPMAGKRDYINTNPFTSEEFQQYESVLLRLLKTPLPLAENTMNELSPQSLTLTEDAYTYWKNVYKGYESLLRDSESDFQSIKGFISKAPEQILRLAGVLFLIERNEESSVPYEYVARAEKIINFYTIEALRLFGQSGVPDELKQAKQLLDWAQAYDQIHPVQIYQFGPNSLRSKSAIEPLIDILEEHGWLIRNPEDTVVEGSPRKLSWTVVKNENNYQPTV